MLPRLVVVLMFVLRTVCRAGPRRVAFVQPIRRSISAVTPRTFLARSQQHEVSPQRSSSHNHKVYATASLTLSSTRLFSSSHEDDSFFAEDAQDFAALGVTSPILLQRLADMGLTRPTAVQSAAYQSIRGSETDVTIGAETGSGKVSVYIAMLGMVSRGRIRTIHSTHAYLFPFS